MTASALTLRSFYERTFLQTFHDDVSPRTIIEYRASIVLWELLAGDEPIESTTQSVITAFRALLQAQPGKQNDRMSPATCNKHFRQLNHIWSKAGPPGPRNRDALGLITAVPWAKSLRAPKRLPRSIPFEAIDRLYAAAAVARHPRLPTVNACTWWRSLFDLRVVPGELRQKQLKCPRSHADPQGDRFDAFSLKLCQQSQRVIDEIVKHWRLLEAARETAPAVAAYWAPTPRFHPSSSYTSMFRMPLSAIEHEGLEPM